MLPTFKNKYGNGIISLEIFVKRKNISAWLSKPYAYIPFFQPQSICFCQPINTIKTSHSSCFFIFRNHRTDRHKLIFIGNQVYPGGSAANFKIFRRNQIRTFSVHAYQLLARASPLYSLQDPDGCDFSYSYIYFLIKLYHDAISSCFPQCRLPLYITSFSRCGNKDKSAVRLFYTLPQDSVSSEERNLHIKTAQCGSLRVKSNDIPFCRS